MNKLIKILEYDCKFKLIINDRLNYIFHIFINHLILII
jgi:hypothetical protein